MTERMRPELRQIVDLMEDERLSMVAIGSNGTRVTEVGGHMLADAVIAMQEAAADLDEIDQLATVIFNATVRHVGRSWPTWAEGATDANKDAARFVARAVLAHQAGK